MGSTHHASKLGLNVASSQSLHVWTSSVAMEFQLSVKKWHPEHDLINPLTFVTSCLHARNDYPGSMCTHVKCAQPPFSTVTLMARVR